MDLIVSAAVGHSVSSIFEIESRVQGGRHGHPPRKRERQSITEIYDWLGPHYFRHAYQMTYDSFWILHRKTCCLIWHYTVLAIRRKKKKAAQQLLVGGVLPPIPNGRIFTSARLGCALRYFAGGCPLDIMVNFGIGYTDVFVSVWSVVMAINRLPEFYISYPVCHKKQREIAASCCEARCVGFDNCAGTIDGILVWTHMPTEKDAGDDIGSKSFLCARKAKFGLNMCNLCPINVDEFLTYLSSVAVHLLIAWLLKPTTYIVDCQSVCWCQG